MIDQQTIDKVVDTAQIFDVVSEFVSLKRRGQNYVGLCPFHSDKNPSFYVSPSKNVCKCFSCGEGGGPVQFLMKHEQITFFEAIKWLGDKYGIEVEDKKMSDEERQRQTAREGMFMATEFAQKTFEYDLLNSEEGRSIGLSYFRERGIQDETIQRFHLGYALDSKYDFANRALAKGYKQEILLDKSDNNPDGTGLCYGDDPRRIPVCRFAGRVIFPYHTLSGKPVAFGGRILQRVDHAFKKYVNSPESEIYHKSDLLYGIFQAKNEMSKQDKCYIVEGNVDVLTMSQSGFINTVASAGTALTTNQIRMIKRFTKNVTLMYDGDAPGVAAALKTIDLLLLEGMNVKLLLFPDGDDPDSFCRKHTTEEIKSYFDQHEQDFVAFKANLMLRGVGNDPIKRGQITQNIVQSLALVTEPVFESLFRHEASQLLGVDEQALIRAIATTRANNYAAEVRKREIEQRREIARQDVEDRKSEGLVTAEKTDESTSSTSTTSENSGATSTSNKNDTQSAPKTVEQSLPLNQTSAQSAEPERVPILSDRYERYIIRVIIQHGGEEFDYKWYDENHQEQIEHWRAIDFIGSELANDGIEFRHPLYAKMLKLALDASADVTIPFDSVKFFTNHTDPEVSKLALNLVDDKYDAMGVAQNNEQVDYIVPRCILELKNAILTMEILKFTQALRQPGCDYASIMGQLKSLEKIKAEFAKELGERVITG